MPKSMNSSFIFAVPANVDTDEALRQVEVFRNYVALHQDDPQKLKEILDTMPLARASMYNGAALESMKLFDIFEVMVSTLEALSGQPDPDLESSILALMALLKGRFDTARQALADAGLANDRSEGPVVGPDGERIMRKGPILDV